MVKRHADSSFGGAYVFPGGVVDASDNAIDDACIDIPRSDVDCVLNVEHDGLGYYVAAVRELFEESGVLLAKHSLHENDLDDARGKLNNGTLEWNRFVSEKKLKLQCRALRYFSHWITPDVIPKRYTTRFFLAKMPGEQVACHDDGELTDAIWTTPEDALKRSKELALHFPTIKTIEQLIGFDSADTVFDWATECERAGVRAIHPVMPGGRPQMRRIDGRPTE